MYLDRIKSHFELTEQQETHFEALYDLYVDWNSKINVISRKDIENLYRNHVLHSLAIAKFVQFKKGSSILDLGCGGGFPGIPLAILFPEVEFTLVDARNKKIIVVNEVIDSLGLENARGYHQRVEDEQLKHDFIITRAVAKIDQLWTWSYPILKNKHINSIPNGLLALKGGDIKQECKLLPRKAYSEYEPISQWFDDPYFDEKYVVYVQ